MWRQSEDHLDVFVDKFLTIKKMSAVTLLYVMLRSLSLFFIVCTVAFYFGLITLAYCNMLNFESPKIIYFPFGEMEN